MTIQQRLKSLRQSKRLTCRQLAQRTGIDYTRISRIENGRTPLFWDDLLLLAHGLEMTPIEVILPVNFSVDIRAA